MNTLCFLGGAGAGALLATIIMLSVLHLAMKNRPATEKKITETNERSVAALIERNEIANRIAVDIHAIAKYALMGPRKEGK